MEFVHPSRRHPDCDRVRLRGCHRVGRVAALAVAFGVGGVILGLPAVAVADTDVPGGSDSASATESDPAAAMRHRQGARRDTADRTAGRSRVDPSDRSSIRPVPPKGAAAVTPPSPARERVPSARAAVIDTPEAAVSQPPSEPAVFADRAVPTAASVTGQTPDAIGGAAAWASSPPEILPTMPAVIVTAAPSRALSATGPILPFRLRGAEYPLVPMVSPIGWAALAVSRREHTATASLVAPAASVTHGEPAEVVPIGQHFASGAVARATTPAGAAAIAHPTGIVAQQIQGFIRQIVKVATQVVQQVIEQVTAVIKSITAMVSPRLAQGEIVDVDNMQVETLQYKEIPGVDPNLLSLDVYYDPAFADRPVMFYIHGGGLKNGDKTNDAAYRAKAPHFVSNEYVYVSINYRLSPDVLSPAHIEDVADAFVYVQDNIAHYGGDPSQMFVMGHSAGAYLASLLATNEKYIEGAGGDLSMIQGVVSLDTWTYMSVQSWQQEELSKDPSERFDAVPANHVETGKGIPPFLIFYRDGRSSSAIDRDQTAFTDLLLANGVPAAAVLGVDDDHIELNREIGTVGDQKTAVIMEFLANPMGVEDFYGVEDFFPNWGTSRTY